VLDPAPPPALRKGSAFPGGLDTHLFDGRLRLPVFDGYDLQAQTSMSVPAGTAPPDGRKRRRRGESARKGRAFPQSRRRSRRKLHFGNWVCAVPYNVSSEGDV
jgi:hypothetical protein